MSTLVTLVYMGIIIDFGALAMMCYDGYDVLTYGSQDIFSHLKVTLKKLFIVVTGTIQVSYIY